MRMCLQTSQAPQAQAVQQLLTVPMAEHLLLIPGRVQRADHHLPPSLSARQQQQQLLQQQQQQHHHHHQYHQQLWLCSSAAVGCSCMGRHLLTAKPAN